MIKALVCLAVAIGLLALRASMSLPAVGDESAEVLLAKSGPLVVAFAQVVEASGRQAAAPPAVVTAQPVDPRETAFLPESLQQSFEHLPPEDPEGVAREYLASFEALEVGALSTRAQWLKFAQLPGVLGPAAGTRLGLRQLEQPTPDRLPDELEVGVLTLASELVRAGEPSLARRAELYSQLESLHPTPECRAAIQRALFATP